MYKAPLLQVRCSRWEYTHRILLSPCPCCDWLIRVLSVRGQLLLVALTPMMAILVVLIGFLIGSASAAPESRGTPVSRGSTVRRHVTSSRADGPDDVDTSVHQGNLTSNTSGGQPCTEMTAHVIGLAQMERLTFCSCGLSIISPQREHRTWRQQHARERYGPADFVGAPRGQRGISL